MAPRAPEIPEYPCLTEEKWSYLAPFLPSSTNLPPKSRLQQIRRIDGQPAAPVFTIGIRLRDAPNPPGDLEAA
jgi:hypothetical protein